MRSVSIACFVGVCFSFAAIACVGGEDADPIPAAQTAPQSAGEAQPASSTSSSSGSSAATVPTTAPSAAPPEVPSPKPPVNEPPPAGDDDDDVPVADGGAPPSDGGNDGGLIIVIKPKPGTLHAEASTGDMCNFILDGKPREKSKLLEIAVAPGSHTLVCERNDGSKAEQIVDIVSMQTTNAILPFKKEGTLTATSPSDCYFYVDDVATQVKGPALQMVLPEGAHTVRCTPVSGAVKNSVTKNFDILSGENTPVSFAPIIIKL